MTTSTSATTSSTFPRSSASGLDTTLGGTPVHAVWTGRDAGDARRVGEGPAPAPVPPQLLVRGVHQVHGAGVLVVDEEPGEGVARWELGAGAVLPDGDAVVARRPGYALTVLTADCAPLALGSAEGIYGAVHVGWRGLVAGVIARAVDALRALGASAPSAGLGPTIGSCCYEFSPADLDRIETALGHPVRDRTTWGTPSLDLRGAIGAQLARAGAVLTDTVPVCTVCAPGYFSHRAHAELDRQALYVWREP